MSYAAHKKAYSFPQLKPAEIIQCMNDLSIPVTEEDLNKPTPARIQVIYETFLEAFMGITREHLEQPNFQVMEVVEFPDIHMESVVLFNFAKHVLKLMTEVGIDDFSLRDVLKPEPPRVRRILSAVINFAKFREEQMAIYDQYTQKSEEIVEQRQLLDQKHAEMTEQLSNLQAQRASEEPAIKEATELNERLSNELQAKGKLQSDLVNEVEELKQQRNDLMDQMTNTQFLLNNCKQECSKLKSRLVYSPEQLKQVIAEQNQNIHTEKSNIVNMEKKTRDLQQKLDFMNLIEGDVSQCIKLMDECQNELKRSQEESSKVFSEKELIDKKQAELRELTIKEQQLTRQLNTALDKMARLQKQQSMKREAAELKLAKLREEYNVIAVERSNVQMRIDENKRIVEDIEQKITDLKKHMDTELSNVQSDYAQLQAQVECYMHELVQSLGLGERNGIRV
ncbi:Nuf2 family-domain-containing protein [Paraphysoderma sedebokerense]|nr:Nuf2 family-domain-containing protein [Paraphysoderma sedebokerense]